MTAVRLVHTRDELADLPEGAVIRDGIDAVYENHRGFCCREPWWSIGNDGSWPDSAVSLPARILFLPGDDEQ